MLYYLNEDGKENLQMLKRTSLDQTGWDEKDLGVLVKKNLTRFLDEKNLMPIFTGRNGKKEPDMMALDKTGTLYFLELKRREDDVEYPLHVLQHGQVFGRKNYEELEELFFLFNKSGKSLIKAHQEYFDLAEHHILKKEEMNETQHFLIITESTDSKTQSAIHYWKNAGLSIDSILYRVYTTSSEEVVMEVDPYSPYKDKLEKEELYYIVNTNFSSNPAMHDDMIKQGKAAAHYHPWKHKIKEIEKGDTVFLYKTGVGIIAMGNGTGIVEEETYQGLEGAEYFTRLEDFSILPAVLAAPKIREITGSKVEFNQTIITLPRETGDVIWKYIKEHMKRE